MVRIEAQHVPPPFIVTPTGIAIIASGIVTAAAPFFIVLKKTLVGR